MSQYQNGQHQYQTPQPSYYQDQYGQPQPSFAGGNRGQYGINGDQQQQYDYSGAHAPHRAPSNASRMNNELFMGQPGAPGPPPPPTQYAAASPPSTYNPQDYNPLSPSLAGPGYHPFAPGAPSAPAPSAAPAPYNPANYAATGSYPAGSPAQSYGYPSSYASPTAAMPSPSIYQNAAANRPTSMYNSRPSVQTSSYSPSSRTSYYNTPAPPPLPAIPGSAESPGDDWGQVPSRYNSNAQHQRRYGNEALRMSPGQASQGYRIPGRDQSSHIENSVSPPYSNPGTPGPPPPPPHTSLGISNIPEQRSGARPLPRLPSDTSSQHDYFAGQSAASSTSRIQADLEQQIMNLTTHDSHTSGGHAANGAYEDDVEDDPEALAGLEAMREAERQDAADAARRESGGFYGMSASAMPQGSHMMQGEASDSDIPIDIASYGGGFDAHMSYGGDPYQLTVTRQESLSDRQAHSQTVSSSSSLRRPNEARLGSEGYGYHDAIHPFPAFTAARVDAFGTGGLEDPSISGRNRRLSYDEGDEAPLLDYSTLAPGEPPDMFYSPGPTNRPLPPPPPGEPGYSYSSSLYPADVPSHHIQFPSNPAQSPGFYQNQGSAGPSLPRHLSEKRFGTVPAVISPARAKTDAEERRKQAQKYTLGPMDVGDSTAATESGVTLDLPSITRKFNPEKLSARDFDRCREPWAVSAIVHWLRTVADGEQFLKKTQLVSALVALFTYKVHTMNVADAETLSDKLIDDMSASGALGKEEEWLVFRSGGMTGVVYQLTGSGCYSSKLHDSNSSLRCYAHLCQRTEKKIDLSAQPAMGDADWASYYHLTKEAAEGVSKKEIERQNILHEIVQKEESYLGDLATLTTLYRDQLATANPPLIAPKKLQGFIWEVFGKADLVKKANEEHLLPQMKYRQKEQGPWVIGFSDIFREWIRKAKAAYVDYASQFPQASYKFRQELEKNMLFRTFIEKCQADPRSRKLDWTHYLKLPITRLQQVILLLETALRKSEQDSDEKRNLIIAIEEIKVVTQECNARVGDGLRKVDLADLQNKLRLRPGMQRVDLNLDHLGRQVLFQGELLRIGENKFSWLETHAILFDHFLVLAKTLNEKGPDGATKSETYDVSRLPIPMDLLVLESRDDDPVVRSSLGGRTVVSKAAAVPEAERLRLARQITDKNASPELRHTSTGNSLTSLTRASSSQSIPPAGAAAETGKEDKTLYPFRIKHLGKQTYQLFASTYQNREDWCNRIEEAKTNHAAALFAQNAEPFKLRVMADTAFAYDSSTSTGQRGIVVKGTPLDRAIRDVEQMHADKGRPGPVCRAKVNCATAFSQSSGKQMVAVGTDFGVFISEMDNSRGWQRVITNPRVTQIAVLEDFSLFLLISDKSLIAYHLDVICPINGVPQPANDSARRAPQKLSGSRDVGFFSTGRMKDRTLVFYKKKDGISSTFKVVEPVLQKATEKKSRFPPLRSGKTDFFREFDEFYIPTECMGINMFTTSIAISTQKGFEIMTLDKKLPVSIPDLEASHVQMIANRLNGQKPLGMFRLNEQEFLLCYEECAVYVNKHGDISRSVIMEFVGKAKSAALFGAYVLLFDPDFVEVRNAQNGRLRQVIAGRDVKCLDDAVGGVDPRSRSVKMSLQHPENEKMQVVLELVLNEGLRE